MSKSKDQFEKFCREDMGWSDDDLKLGYLQNGYFWEKAKSAWNFWQSSREALIVQLPLDELYEDGKDEWGYQRYANAYPAEEIIECLKEAGIKFKY